MVNSEAFTKRLKIIIEYYNISAAVLAEKMDVQRSSISHILSGRNKPSLDFVMKILKAFPEVELYWLLNGIGEFPKNSKASSPTHSPAPVVNHKIETSSKIVPEQSQPTICTNNEIERIVVFYKDGTFKNYIP